MVGHRNAFKAKGGRAMIQIVRHFLNKLSETSSPAPAREGCGHDVRVAVCALLLEMAQIDKQFTKEELKTILDLLMDRYDLSRDEANAIIEEADQELKDSLDAWQFARLINEAYTPEEKMAIVETLWQVVFVDGKMDQHENYLMHKFSNLLRLSNKQLIDAKLRVLHPPTPT
jgi:uncharacterized tellurite resistance protein B-like protein